MFPSQVERNCLGTQLDDLRKLGVATDCWFEDIFREISAQQGDLVADKYRKLVRGLKKKQHKKQPKKKWLNKSRGKWKGTPESAGAEESISPW